MIPSDQQHPKPLLTPPRSPTSKPIDVNLNVPAPQNQNSQKDSFQLHHKSNLPIAKAASGIHITLSDGRTIIDGTSGPAVAAIGMGNTEVIDAMVQQAKIMGYAYHQCLGNEPGEELSKWLVERSRGVFGAAGFLTSGSEAIEGCIRTARQYWVEKGQPERKYLITRLPSYHGNTITTLAAGFTPSRRDIFKPLFPSFIHHISSPSYKRSHLPGESQKQYSIRLAQELENKILELGAGNVMAFMIEPVAGGTSMGIMPPPEGYILEVVKVCRKYGVLVIFDEVMCGMGRCGELFAYQAVGEGATPDLLAIAKALGAGYSTISGILLSPEITQTLRKAESWKTSHTYQNHPVNCAAALKVQKIVEREGLLGNVRERGEQLLRELRGGLDGEEGVWDIRGKGLFVGIEFTAPSNLSPRLAQRVKDQCFKNGLMVLSQSGFIDGKEGEGITLAPAFIVTKDQISEIVEIVVKSIKEVMRDLREEQ